MKHQGVNYILEIFTTGTVLVLLFHLLSYTFYFFMPVWFFFDYVALEPVKPVYSHTEPITIKSTEKYNRKLQVEWQYTLRCPPIEFFNQATTHGFKSKSMSNEIRAYQNEMPLIDSECYIDSTITVTTDYGIKKSMRVQSPTFLIK